MAFFSEQLYYEKRDDEVFIIEGTLSCPPHLHHVVEIGIVLTGAVTAGVDQKEYVLLPGDILISFPNQVHMYEPIRQSRDLVLFLEPDSFPELEAVFSGMIPACSVVHDETGELTALVQTAMAENEKAATAFTKSAVKGLMLFFLSRLLGQIPLQKKEDSSDNQSLRTLKRILYYCDDHYREESFCLESAASALNISRFYLSRLFNERLKISFSDYLGQLRVRQACRLLSSGRESISWVALECGFNSIRSFNRHFLSITGMTPSDYRKSAGTRRSG